MNEFIGYIIKSGISLVVLYFFYWLLLRKDTHFRLNRSVLLFSIIGSLLVPFINIYFIASQQIKTDIPVFYASINEVVVRAIAPTKAATGSSVDWWRIVTILYVIGAFVVFARLVYQAIYLHVMTKLSKTIRNGKFTIVIMNADITPFAYFNKVFIPESKADDISIETIVAHERAHQQQYHYVDLFIMQLVTVLQWFNPIVWLYERSLKETHEYLADDTVLKNGHHKGTYQALLVNEALGGPAFSLTNQFNQSLIKKRIRMMTKMRSSRATQLKVLLVFPIMLLILFAFANPNAVVKPAIEKGKEILNLQSQTNVALQAASEENEGNGDISVNEKLSGANIVNKDTIVVFCEQMPQYPGGEDSMKMFLFRNIRYPRIAAEMGIQGQVTTQFVVDQTGKINNIKILRGVGGGCDEEAIRVIKLMPFWKPGMQKGKVVSVYFTLPISFSNNIGKADEAGVYSIVEQMPEYSLGMDSLMHFLYKNIKYPEEAIKKNITGKVFIQFIIDSKGKVSNAKVLRGIGGGCDEEAIRVVKTLPDWIPGKQGGKPVSVYFVLPIIFQLKE